MPTAQIAKPLAHSESKSSKKKKAKAEVPTQVPASSPEPDAVAGDTNGDGSIHGADGSHESPYMKELNKNIRNTKKKLNATQKVDSIMKENPDSSLDDLLTSRKINQDQKTQAEKIPSLKASLTQLEAQVAQYKQFDDDYQKRLSEERSVRESAYKDELEKVRDAALIEAAAEHRKAGKENLLVLSKFLRAAAAKRQAGDEASPENRAFEGALLLVYGGEAGAVVAMENLIAGNEEKVPTVDGNPSEFTYKQVRDLAFEHAPYAAEEAWAEEVAQSEPAPPGGEDSSLVGTDPTVAHAGLTELDTQPDPIQSERLTFADNVPDASQIDVGAANEAAGDNWKKTLVAPAESGPDDWVEVTRDPAETDTGNAATPAGMTSTQSWADEVTADPTDQMPTPAYAKPPTNEKIGGDGFSEVHHGHGRGGRGRSSGQGEHRGAKSGRGVFRGERNESGARGRGGFRGDRGVGDGGTRGRGRSGRGRDRGRGDASS